MVKQGGGSFIVQVRRISRAEGFKGIAGWICHYHSQGYAMPDLKVHVEEVHGVYYSLSCYWGLKKWKDVAVTRWGESQRAGKRYGFVRPKVGRLWVVKARRLGWKNPKAAVRGLRREGLTYKQVARYFGVTVLTLHKRRQKWGR